MGLGIADCTPPRNVESALRRAVALYTGRARPSQSGRLPGRRCCPL